LELSASNLRVQEGKQLAASLRVNSTLQIVNLDGNHLDSDAVYDIIVALTENAQSEVTSFSCTNQIGVGRFFGKKVEQAVVDLCEQNKKITRLNFHFRDEYLLNVVDKAIRANRDASRRRRKRSTIAGKQVQDKIFSSLLLTEAPADKKVEEVFPQGDDSTMALARKFTAEKRKICTKEQLQVYAKKQGKPVKYSEVAPLLRQFRQALMNSMINAHVKAADAGKQGFEGIMTLCAEKNETWVVTLVNSKVLSFNLTSRKDITIDMTDEVAYWLWPSLPKPAQDAAAAAPAAAAES